MARKNPFANLMEEKPTDNGVALDYTIKGASRSIMSSIDELAERADRLLEGETMVELDTDLVDASFVRDRLEEDPQEFADLLGAIRSVVAGDAVVAPSTTRRLLDHFAALPDPGAPAASDDRLRLLTEREVEVLTLIARGRTNPEIAADLVVAETTVKTHVGRILAKTGSRDRVQLVVLGYESGLVAP